MRCCPRVVSRIFCLAWCIFCCLGVVGIFGEEMLSFGAVRVSRERNSLYQGMFIFFSYLIYKEQRLGTMQTSSPTNYLQRSQHATRFLRGGMRASISGLRAAYPKRACGRSALRIFCKLAMRPKAFCRERS